MLTHSPRRGYLLTSGASLPARLAMGISSAEPADAVDVQARYLGDVLDCEHGRVVREERALRFGRGLHDREGVGLILSSSHSTNGPRLFRLAPGS